MGQVILYPLTPVTFPPGVPTFSLFIDGSVPSRVSTHFCQVVGNLITVDLWLREVRFELTTFGI